MSHLVKRRSRLTVPHFVGLVLSKEQEDTLDTLAADLGGDRERVLLVGLWLLSKVSRSRGEVSVFTEWGGN